MDNDEPVNYEDTFQGMIDYMRREYSALASRYDALSAELARVKRERDELAMWKEHTIVKFELREVFNFTEEQFAEMFPETDKEE